MERPCRCGQVCVLACLFACVLVCLWKGRARLVRSSRLEIFLAPCQYLKIEILGVFLTDPPKKQNLQVALKLTLQRRARGLQGSLSWLPSSPRTRGPVRAGQRAALQKVQIFSRLRPMSKLWEKYLAIQARLAAPGLLGILLGTFPLPRSALPSRNNPLEPLAGRAGPPDAKSRLSHGCSLLLLLLIIILILLS